MTGDDKPRCTWPGDDELMLHYHDEEWGLPVHEDRKWFEYMVLDAFQAGLSWKTVLHKRQAFRKVFRNFDPVRLAGMSKKQIELIHRWLLSWTRRTPLSATLDQTRHLFYVNLDEDRGARRIRSERLDRSASNRYWNTGQLMITLSRATGVRDCEAPFSR